MKTIFTIRNNEYYTTNVTPDKECIKIPFVINPLQKIEKELDDLFFDYLDCWDFYDKDFMSEYKDELISSGYDLNFDNYICVICPYLPFRHYININENWII